jgi:hypothetical protein
MKYLSVEVVICHTTTNFKFDQSVFALSMTVRHIFEISEDDHPLTIVGDRRPRSLMNFRLG